MDTEKVAVASAESEYRSSRSVENGIKPINARNRRFRTIKRPSKRTKLSKRLWCSTQKRPIRAKERRYA